jgi:hypothetical protein
MRRDLCDDRSILSIGNMHNTIYLPSRKPILGFELSFWRACEYTLFCIPSINIWVVRRGLLMEPLSCGESYPYPVMFLLVVI